MKMKVYLPYEVESRGSAPEKFYTKWINYQSNLKFVQISEAKTSKEKKKKDIGQTGSAKEQFLVQEGS